MFDYIRQPDAIYKRSFEIIAAEADFSALPADAHAVATRMIHACGMTDIVGDLVISADFVAGATAALKSACPIFVDAEMVRHGIIAKRLAHNNEIICTLNNPDLQSGMTRSAAAVDLWVEQLAGSIVVIGNAPTALFHLLELIDASAPKPAAIVALPVGFVGAAESKQEVIDNPRGIPFITLKGRRGGSAMASAVINALGNDAA